MTLNLGTSIYLEGVSEIWSPRGRPSRNVNGAPGVVSERARLAPFALLQSLNHMSAHGPMPNRCAECGGRRTPGRGAARSAGRAAAEQGCSRSSPAARCLSFRHPYAHFWSSRPCGLPCIHGICVNETVLGNCIYAECVIWVPRGEKSFGRAACERSSALAKSLSGRLTKA